MPVMETVTIINKSGKVVNTVGSRFTVSNCELELTRHAQGKHLVNIFKDARGAYAEKKEAMRAEHKAKVEFKQAQKLLEARNHHDDRSVAGSRRSHKHRDDHGVSRPPLTQRGLTRVDEGSVASGHSRRRSRSQTGSRRGSVSGGYQRPYVEDAALSQPHLVRRHTDFQPHLDTDLALRPPLPTHYSTRDIHRSSSNPNLRAHHDPHIDMNLAYGSSIYDHMDSPTESEKDKEIELAATMSKLDHLLLEAKCVSHSATTIIKNLQANPEAMAAVALTLAELSNILKTMSPGILTALKSSSPAAFALLASPQFLIAGGVALGVTVVMFGGFKIVKKIQANNEAKKEANRMEEALVWEPSSEMGSIETWRRGITAADGLPDDNTSVDGEFITPEAARQRKERIRERRREERSNFHHYEERSVRGGSVAGESVRSERTVRRIGSESTIRRKPLPVRTRTEYEPSHAGSYTGSRRGSVKGSEIVEVKPRKEKERKSSGLASIFGGGKKDKEEKKSKKDKKGGRAVEV
jgi:hypothetical protein